MTEILDAIELELVGAVRRHNAGARRRRLKAAAATVVAALALGGATVTATIVDSPLDALFPSGAPDAVKPLGAARSTVVATDDAGVGWDVSAYRTRGGMLATVILQRPRPAGPPAVVGRSGLFVALGAQQGAQASVGTDAVERDGRVHVVVGGNVPEPVTAVAVTLGGRRHVATVAEEAVTVPVRLGPGDRPTEELMRQLDELPDTVSRRAFAVALPSTAAPVGRARVPAAVELTFRDGAVATERRTLCVSPRCMGD